MAKILQLKIALNGIKPEIWRRFLVEDSISFKRLHKTIQTVMGWEDYHMYKFCIDNEEIVPEEEGYNLAESSFNKLFKSPEFMKMLEQLDMKKGSATLDVDKMNKMLHEMEQNKAKNQYDINSKINQLIKSEKQKFTYLYDFGDSWEHTIVVEKILEKDQSKKYPICLEGERACPPEDCGSIPGYYNLIKIRKNKKHPQYEELIVEWLGEDYDPELFIVDWVNAKLHGKRPAPVWVPSNK